MVYCAVQWCTIVWEHTLLLHIALWWTVVNTWCVLTCHCVTMLVSVLSPVIIWKIKNMQFCSGVLTIEFGSSMGSWFMCHTWYLKSTIAAENQLLQLKISWSAYYRLKMSWMDSGLILWLDLCATNGVLSLQLLFKVCSWFSAVSADFRYQVWHINQDPILDRHSMVVVSELKSKIFYQKYVSWVQNMFCSGLRGATTPSKLKFGIQPSTNLYFHQKKFQPWTPTFLFFQLITHGPSVYIFR